jgi:predicted  nucleic acid-binding Zn-ribbon protein
LQVARQESETAKRDAQVAKNEIEALNAERARLNTALQRLETDKTAAEGKARVMESATYAAARASGEGGRNEIRSHLALNKDCAPG